jgi:branched-chain amino acid transport system substrate-binding protein
MAALALSLAPLWVHAQAAAPPKIGLVGPITGPSSDFGVPMTNGVKLAVDEINAVGGYLGRPLQLVLKDDKGDPDTGR